MDRNMHVVLVDPVGKLAQVERALRIADAAATAETVASPAGIDETDAPPDCVVVLDCDGVDGLDLLSASLDRVDDVPVVAFAITPGANFVRDAQSTGAADVVCIPAGESADELFPDVLARRLRHAAGHIDPFHSDGELLDSLLEGLPHQVFIKNGEGRFEDASRAAAAEYGLDRDQLVGLTDSDLIPPDVVSELRDEEREIMASEEPVINKEEHFVDGDGRDRWVSTTKAPRYDGDGEVVGIIGTTREVTEQKRQEEMMNALHAASRDLLAAESRREIAEITVDIAEEIPDLPFVQVAFLDDENLAPVAASDEVPPASEDGDDRDRGPGDVFEEYELLYLRSFETGDAQYVGEDGVDPVLPPDGSDPTGMVLPLGDHGVLGVFSTSGAFDEFGVDLAEVLAANVEAALDRAAREEELARQNERLEEFASIVSHDLRNPLSVAQGYVELLESDEDAVDEIDWALGRIESLTDDLLTLARSGDVVGETETESLEGVVFEAWQAVDTGSASLGVEGALGTVEADRARLLELFENLFSNAVEHGASTSASNASSNTSPPDSASEPPVAHASGGADENSVTVTVGPLENGFFVEDDGPGIPDEEKEAVFERGHTSNEAGTGLGLHIVETLTAAHGWSVSVTDGRDGGEASEASRSSEDARSAPSGVSDEHSESEARQTESVGGARFEFTTASAE